MGSEDRRARGGMAPGRSRAGGVAARSVRIAMIMTPTHHPPPPLSRTEAYLHRSLRFRCVSSRLPSSLPSPSRTSVGAANSVFRRAAAGGGWVNKGNLLWCFRDVFATNVFHRNIFGERRFPRRRQERPPRRPPTIEIPCYLCVPQTPTVSRSPRSIEAAA